MKKITMNLVKDFVAGRIVLYWEDSADTRVSPMLKTLEEAEEWWLKHQFSQHQGEERRQGLFDRRRNHSHRDATALELGVFTENHSGRRFTDRAIRINKDLSQARIAERFAPQMSGDAISPRA